MNYRNKFLIMFIMLSGYIFAQDVNPYKLIDSVKEKFDAIQDYQVDAEIKVDVNFLKVPETQAHITFKQPDKIKLESDGFALLPRQSMNFIPAKLFNMDYTAIYVRSDTVNGRTLSVIKVIPNSDTSEVILSTLWIDSAHKIIRKIESTTKRMGTVAIELQYDQPDDIPLPHQAVFTFDVKGFNMPMRMPSDPDMLNDVKNGSNKSITGTVTISYSNYLVNTGISDEFFSKDEND